jgi:hypothetical protein
VSGALPERAFGRKIEKVGFEEVWIGERIPFGVDQVGLYPLFTPALVDGMRRLLPPERASRVATSVIAKARKPTG